MGERRGVGVGEVGGGGGVGEGQGSRGGVDGGVVQSRLLERGAGGLLHDGYALHERSGGGGGGGVGHDKRHVELDAVLEVHGVAGALHAGANGVVVGPFSGGTRGSLHHGLGFLDGEQAPECLLVR